jgi:hypothetical protein
LACLSAVEVTAMPDAGPGTYLRCIQICRGTDQSWWTAIGCPVICAPFLLAKG